MNAKILMSAFLLTILSSCTIARVPTYETDRAKDNYYIRKTVVENAQTFLGRKYINVEGRRFNYDCSGFVLAVYHKSGIDISGRLKSGRNLVKSIYEYAQKDGIIYKEKTPKPGDIVFFSETLRSGRRDLSHIGIVEKSDPKGTVSFIHKSGRGIRRSFLNLATPSVAKENDLISNSYLRRRRQTDQPGTKYLAGELFTGYGNIIDKKTSKDIESVQDTESIPTVDLSTQVQQIQ